MAIKNSKRLIIDASILQAAGITEQPTSKQCRGVLRTVISVCHRAVLTPILQDEWDKHAQRSAVAREWITAMQGRKEKLQNLTRFSHSLVQPEVEILAIDPFIKRIILKDVHLVEAALSMDRIIISLDERAKHHFSSIVSNIPDLTKLMWVNPLRDENVIDWLKQGAEPDKRRCLGFTDDET